MIKKLLIGISVLLTLITIAGIIAFSLADNEKDSLSQSLQTVKSKITAIETSRKQNELKSTADEIANLEREIAELNQSTDKGTEEIVSTVVKYIDTLYNYDGDLKSQKADIISALSSITDENYLKFQIEPLFETGQGNISKKTNKHKKVNNFCTSNDVYVSIDEYDDGSDVYIAICALHYESNVIYRELSLAQMNDGKIKIKSDGLLSSTRIQLGG